MTIKKTGQRHWLRFVASWLTPLVALVVWLGFWPVPIEPVAWQAPKDAGYTGPHATNTRLAGLQQWPLPAGQEGPEHITAHQGQVYTALANGDVVRLGPEGQVEKLANTGGRPLGLEVSPNGTLYIADAMKGLLAMRLTGGASTLKPLVTEVDHPLPNDPIRYADAVALDVRGNVWFSDASRRFSAREVGSTFDASVLDIMENSCTGRLLVLDPFTQRHREALSGLCFPNGLAFSADGRSLFVAETGRYRILKVDLAALSTTRSSQGMSNVPSLKDAMDQGAARILIDNLPGYPDNLTRGENGRLWTGLTKPRSKLLDLASDKPWLRQVMVRLPKALWPVPPAYGHVFAFDENGRIVDDLQDPKGAYPETTAATEVGGKLFIQSLHAHSVGWMPYSGPAR
jgi:sugar lactone lactonase YvrE